MLPYLLVLVSICAYKTCLGHVPDSAWSIQLYCVWDMSQALKAHGNQASASVTVCYSLCRTMVMSLMPEACYIPPYIHHMVYTNKTSSHPCPRTRSYFTGKNFKIPILSFYISMLESVLHRNPVFMRLFTIPSWVLYELVEQIPAISSCLVVYLTIIVLHCRNDIATSVFHINFLYHNIYVYLLVSTQQPLANNQAVY